jgi:hypothetical protein
MLMCSSVTLCLAVVRHLAVSSHLHVPPHRAPPRCMCHVARPLSPHMPCCRAPHGCACHLAVLLDHTHCIAGLFTLACILLVHFFFLFFSVNYHLWSSHHALSPCSLLMDAQQSFPSRAYHGPTTNRDDKGTMAMTCSNNSDHNNCDLTVAPRSATTVTTTPHHGPTPHGATNVTAIPCSTTTATATPCGTTTMTPCSTMTMTPHVMTTMTAIPHNMMTVTVSTFCFC